MGTQHLIDKFEEDHLVGRGSLEARTFLPGDLLVVRLRGVRTPTELKLAGMRGAGCE